MLKYSHYKQTNDPFMLNQTFTKITVGILTLAIIFSFSLFPQSTLAATDKETELDALSKDLIVAGEFIMSSKTISDAERLTLMAQLIAVSNAILTLKKSLRGTVEIVPEDDESDRVTAKAAGLKRVTLSYDALSNVAKVTTKQSNTLEDKIFKFDSVAEKTSYDSKISQLKKEVIKEVASSTNVFKKEVEKLIFLTSRNTNRVNYIIQNSKDANSALEDFGKESVVNKIVVSPGAKAGSIEFFSDQDESLKLTLAKEYRENRESGSEELGTFTYSYEFFVSTDMDKSVDLFQDGDGRYVYVKTPKVITVTSGVKKDEIVKAITNLFSQVPFTSQVPKFQEKIVNYIANNPAYYLTPYAQWDPTKWADCSKDSDKVVVIDFLRYLSDGLDVQYENVNDIVRFVTPELVDNERGWSSKCMDSSRFF